MKELLDRLEELALEVTRLKATITELQSSLVNADAALEAKVVVHEGPWRQDMTKAIRRRLDMEQLYMAEGNAGVARAIDQAALEMQREVRRFIDVHPILPDALTATPFGLELVLMAMPAWRLETESHQAHPAWSVAQQVLRPRW